MSAVSSRAPLSIVYLLEDTPLFGGVLIVLRQADLMARLGHQVTVVGPGAPPSWYRLDATYRQTKGLDPADIPPADVTVATYWTTVARARDGAKGEALHFCQGFEAIYTHNRADHAAILEAYREPMPAMAVSPHLADLLTDRFQKPARYVPNPLSPAWAPRAADPPIGRTPRILVTGPFEIDWKGVRTALEAVSQLRAMGIDCTLVRISQWPLGDDERALASPDEFHEHLAPRDVPALVRSCDLHLAPSWEQEGLGMPVLESLASGVPVVASDISSFRGFASGAAALVPFDDPTAFATAAREVLTDRDRWLHMHRAGIVAASANAPERAARQADDTFHWVASGAWRDER